MNAKPLACRLCGSSAIACLGTIPDSNFFAGRALTQVLAGGHLWRCVECRSMFRFPILAAEDYLRLYQAGAPDQWTGTDDREDFLTVRDVVARERADSVLDVGCGSGDFLCSLPDTIRRFAIEPSVEAAAVARGRGIDVIGAEIGGSGNAARFAAVTMIDVIEHVPDPGPLLDRAYSLVRPGGVLVVSTGNPEARAWQFLRGRFWYVSFPEHISFPALTFFEDWSARRGAIVSERRQLRYRNSTAPMRLLGLVMQMAYVLSPLLFNLAGRSMHVARTSVGEPGRLTYSPGIPGTFLDHHVVVIRRPR